MDKATDPRHDPVIHPLQRSVSYAFELYASECLEIHRICNEAGIPKDAFGEKLSMAQRVQMLADEGKL